METHSVNTLTADLLAAKNIAKKDLEREADLMRSCWWEYRGMHPTNKTLLFAAEYVAARQRYTSKYIDHAKAEYVTGIHGDAKSIFNDLSVDTVDIAFMTERQAQAALKEAATRKKNLTGLWRGRQAADELSINYGVYLSAIFEKASMSGWSNLPLATQIYGAKQKLLALDAQILQLESYIPDFTNPLLMVGSQAPFKAEFDEWLFEFGKLRKVHKDLAYRRMASLGYITPEQAERWIEIVS